MIRVRSSEERFELKDVFYIILSALAVFGAYCAAGVSAGLFKRAAKLFYRVSVLLRKRTRG